MSSSSVATDVSSMEKTLILSTIKVFDLLFGQSLTTVKNKAQSNANDVSAYITISNEDNTVGVCLSISQRALLFLAGKTTLPIAHGPNKEIIQDIACEALNIIANDLRSQLSSVTGNDFTMTIPAPTNSMTTASIVMQHSLFFQLAEFEPIELTFWTHTS